MREYRPDIDGLRAVAVTAVVAYHAGFSAFPGGFVGVDVFFVISGFLITRLLLGEAERTGGISFADFYARRMKRLLPALLLVLVATLLLNILLLPGFVDVRKFAASIRWSAFGFANVFFKRNTGGYFDGATEEMPLLHLWSLGVEEQFYLCWPVLLALCLRRKRNLADSWPARLGSVKLLLAIIALISFLGACLKIHLGRTPEAFFLMPYRAWELAVGALLACAPLRAAADARGAWQKAAAWAGLALVAAPIFLYSSSTDFPGMSASAPVIGTALLIWAGARFPDNAVSRVLSARTLVRIGLLSYGWYLWHWPLLVSARLWNLGDTPSVALRVSLVVLSLIAAELSLRWVETPVRKGRVLRDLRPLRITAAGLVLSALILVASFGVARLQDGVLSARIGNELVRQIREVPRFSGRCFSSEEIGSEACEVSFMQGGPGLKPAPGLAIWGDSHACSYFPMLEYYGKSRGLTAIQYCEGQSPALAGGPNAEAVFRALGKKVKELAPAPVSVILVSRWVAYTGKKSLASDHRGFPVLAGDEKQSLHALKERLMRTYDALRAIGVFRVLVVLPTPEFRYPLVRCLLRGAASCKTSRSEVEDYRRDAVRAIRESAAGRDGVRLIDPTGALCEGASCPQVLGGMPVVIDTNHVSVRASEAVGKLHARELDWVTGVR